jgi:hypothetical protein
MTASKSKVMLEITNWHQSALGLLTFGVVELGLAFVLASLAIDRGTLWWYILAIAAFIGALQNFIKLIRKTFYEHKSPKT